MDHSLSFTITGMHCDACSKVCTMDLKEIPGVTKVQIDPATGKTVLESSQLVTMEQVTTAIKADGYGVQP